MSYHHDIFVMKTNKHGDSLWHKTYGGICAEGARNIIKTSDGGFAIIGEKDCPNNSTDPSAYLLRLDANGDSLWVNIFINLTDMGIPFNKQMMMAI